MRVWVVAVAVAVTGACGDDPSLHVRVEHPAALEVVKTVVTVYESATLTCIDVAFIRLGLEELSAIEVAAQTIEADGTVTGELSGISRVDHKVIVARGFDATGKAISGGCAEQDIVEDRTNVDIKTLEMVNVSLVPPNSQDIDPLRAIVVATDKTGKPVDGRRVAWTVFGPAGSEPAAAATIVSDGVWRPTQAACTANGKAETHPIPPSTVGGYAVQVGVEWASQLPPLYSSLTNASFGFGSVQVTPHGTLTKSTRFCAVRVKGATRRLVCLDGNVAREYEVIVANGRAALTLRDMQPATMVGLGEARVVISVPVGTDRDVYAVTTRGFLHPLFAPTITPSNATTICPMGATACATEVEDAIAVPPCGASTGKIVLRVRGLGPGQFRQMNANGGGLTSFPADPDIMPNWTSELDNAGCVSRLEPGLGMASQRQVVTYHVVLPGTELVTIATRAVYNCGANCMRNELVPGAGVGFTSGAEPRMIASAIDATGVVLVHVVMAPDDVTGDRLVERSRLPTAAPPDKLLVGQYDSDSTSDMFWNITARRGTTFEVAYARLVGDLPLEALSPTMMYGVAGMISADLTGEGIDDLVITESTGLGELAGIAVIAVDAVLPAPTVKSDTTCAN